MTKRKTIMFVGDGMADEPIPELGGLTPLQKAETPGMDRIAREGVSGTFVTLPDGFPTGSEVANMSILGCDLPKEYCGRGPLEAAGRGIPLGADDLAFRINLISEQDGVLVDFSGDRIGRDDAASLIRCLDESLGSESIRFFPGVSYRNLLVLSGRQYSPHLKTDKPDDHQGQRVADHLPQALDADAETTADLLRRLMVAARPVLAAAEVNQRLTTEGRRLANGIWPWSGGRAGAIRGLEECYGVRGATIAAVDVIIGLGRCLGMDVIHVPGATGYVDTNLEGKADAAVEALEDHDFVFVHVEAIDEVSHDRNLTAKLEMIEAFDRRLVSRVMAGAGDDVNYAVLPDHPVPVSLGIHTRTPVPVAIRSAGCVPDQVQRFDEESALSGSLGLMKGDDVMRTLFAASS